MIEQAMTMIGPDSHEEGRLLSDYGLAMGLHQGDYDGAQEALSRAITIAKREGDAGLEMRSLCHAARIDRLQGRISDALDKSLSALQLVAKAEDPPSEADAHFQAGGHYLMLGDSDAARYRCIPRSPELPGFVYGSSLQSDAYMSSVCVHIPPVKPCR